MDVNEAMLDEIEERFTLVLTGEKSRWDAHAWAEAMLFAPDGDGYAAPVLGGLQALHGITMVETTPGRISHLESPGVTREWMVSEHALHERFAAFTRDAQAWRDSPERYLDEVVEPRRESSLLAAEIDEIERSMGEEDGGG